MLNNEVSGRPFKIIVSGEVNAPAGKAFRYVEPLNGMSAEFKAKTQNGESGRDEDKLFDAGSHDFSSNGNYDTGLSLERFGPLMNVAFSKINATSAVIAFYW